MPGRTWIIAPDADSLQRRWEALVKAKPERKEELFRSASQQRKTGRPICQSRGKERIAGFRGQSKAHRERPGRMFPADTLRLPLV